MPRTGMVAGITIIMVAGIIIMVVVATPLVGNRRRYHRSGRRCRIASRVLRGTTAAGLLRIAAGLLLRTATARLLRLLSRLALGPPAGAMPRRHPSNIADKSDRGTIR